MNNILRQDEWDEWDEWDENGDNPGTKAPLLLAKLPT